MHPTSAALWEADRRVMSDDDIFDVLEPLLFGWHHEGIRRTGEAYPLFVTSASLTQRGLDDTL